MVRKIKLKEREWQMQVIDAAHLFGWRVAHFRPARIKVGGQEVWRTPVAADGAGFPDLVLAKSARVIFAELKTDSGSTTPEQDNWIRELGGSDGIQLRVMLAKHRVFVWRPCQWQEIEKVLRNGF